MLGLVTTKTGELEDSDLVAKRIDEAATIVPLDQLALSPQCGFASTEEGNVLTDERAVGEDPRGRRGRRRGLGLIEGSAGSRETSRRHSRAARPPHVSR